MTSPHRVGQLAKAELALAEPLERWNLTDPNQRAHYLLEQLLELGWTPPRDPATDQPPLRPEHPSTGGPGYQEWLAARQALDTRRALPSRNDGEGT